MNPVERTGRIDRYAANKAFIFNLVLADTVEDRILARPYDRIDFSREAVGDPWSHLGTSLRS